MKDGIHKWCKQRPENGHWLQNKGKKTFFLLSVSWTDLRRELEKQGEERNSYSKDASNICRFLFAKFEGLGYSNPNSNSMSSKNCIYQNSDIQLIAVIQRSDRYSIIFKTAHIKWEIAWCFFAGISLTEFQQIFTLDALW